MVSRGVHLAAAALLGSLAGAMPVSAGNLSFLDKSPLTYFTPADMQMMRQAALKVLDDSAANAQQSWSNDSTGASGMAQVRGEFKATDGATCKRLHIVNKVKGLESSSTYTTCKYPDRGWVVNTDATPAE